MLGYFIKYLDQINTSKPNLLYQSGRLFILMSLDNAYVRGMKEDVSADRP